MFGIENFPIFLTTGILLNLYPGPDTIYIIGRSISQGRMAGIFAVLGISSGGLFHIFIGSIGLSAIIFASARAFMIVKYAGAAYLLYQAYLMIKDSGKFNNSIDIDKQKKSLFKIYRQGMLTNILNPKVALFFLAFLPQFILPASHSKPLSFIILGLVFFTTGTIWCMFISLFSSYFSQRLRGNHSISKWLMRANAGLFAYLGIRLAASKLSGR
jgi:threonine/homoserine/homoserine lactone efflux protein